MGSRYSARIVSSPFAVTLPLEWLEAIPHSANAADVEQPSAKLSEIIQVRRSALICSHFLEIVSVNCINMYNRGKVRELR